MIFKSKPHTIRAFKFTLDMQEPPQWFSDAVVRGNAAITIGIKGDKKDYIRIYNLDRGGKAYLGDWICINDAGVIFILSQDELNNAFEVGG